ncbi:beta-propeller domain-containing protein [Candidatus Peribacteria bacterium]|nr:beta-propeller domain-containing protein [Candidatus Peribacteria bacterium]
MQYRFLGFLIMATPLLTSTAFALKLAAPFVPTVEQSATGTFSDILDGHPFSSSIEYLYSHHIIDGYDDGLFRPGQRVNRAEFTKMVYGYINDTPKGEDCFPDVTDEWFAPYVCSALQDGIVEGYDDGLFHPENYITLAEAAKIIASTYALQGRDTGDVWYAPYVSALADAHALPLSIDQLDRPLRRDEVAEILGRLMEKNSTKNSQTLTALTDPIGTVSSCSALLEMMDAPNNYTANRYGMAYGMGVESLIDMAADTSMMQRTAAPAMVAMESESAKNAVASDDYSTTNVQVEGVDEADTIKTDGKYLYVISQSTVQIIEALPAADMQVVSTLEWGESFYPTELYVSEHRLVVVGNSAGFYDGRGIMEDTVTPWDVPEASLIAPPRYNREKTRVYIYDTSNASAPQEIENYAFEGNYQTSRRLGEHLYLVMNRYADPVIMPYWRDQYPRVMEGMPAPERENTPQVDLPLYQRGDEELQLIAPCSGIRYLPGNHYQNYLIVAAINIETPTLRPQTEVFLGQAETVYVNAENLYVALPMYNQALYTDWNYEKDEARQKTMLFRFALEDGAPELQAKGYAEGSLLNQFSLDEYQGALRVATHINDWDSRQSIQTNNVFTYNASDLTPLGSIRDIAPGESIYSTRFMGEKLYMVTFQQVDPLFVIDLQDPKKPAILGKLKIPGYSNYLHPYDDTHLIGFGKDAVAAKDSDFAWYQGMKVAIFDVSDVEHPVQMHEVVIGDRGTDSELLYNHKALLFDKSRDLLAFPITVAQVKDRTAQYSGQEEASIYGETVFQGAHVYNINLKDGITPRGEITHYSEEDMLKMGDYYPYDYEKNIQRIVRIDNVLYTLSPGAVYATDGTTMQTLSHVDL